MKNKFIHTVDDRDYWESIDKSLADEIIVSAEQYNDFIWRTLPVSENIRFFKQGNQSDLKFVEMFFEKRRQAQHLLVCITSLQKCIDKVNLIFLRSKP